MKFTLTILCIFLNLIAFSQSNRSELAKSKIYYRGTYIDHINKIVAIQTRTDLVDTLIDNVIFHKFQTSEFIDDSKKIETKTYYESYSRNIYWLLDSRKKTIHKINYLIDKEQFGTIFGKEAYLTFEFIDQRKSYPKDSLVPTINTPRRFIDKDNSEIYLVIIPDLKTVAVASDGYTYVKQLLGDIYNDISSGITNNYTASTKFDIQKGDEIQLFYRRKWYNDTTSIAEYTDKEFKNIKYLGDTIANNMNALKFEVESYNYLAGEYKNHIELLVPITDSGYYIGDEFVPFKEYKTELKLIDNKDGFGLFLQGVTYDSVEGYTYQKIAQVRNNYYRLYYLPFFPMAFTELGNVQGMITYSKIKGIEQGKKHERTYITDRSNLRDIFSKGKNKIEIDMYFVSEDAVEIEIQGSKPGEIIAKYKRKSKIGLNSFVIRSKKLNVNTKYLIEIRYKNKNSSGFVQTWFKTI